MATFLKVLAGLICALFVAGAAFVLQKDQYGIIDPAAIIPFAVVVFLIAVIFAALGVILERVDKIEHTVRQRSHEPSIRTKAV